jgi:hypothetical protein
MGTQWIDGIKQRGRWKGEVVSFLYFFFLEIKQIRGLKCIRKSKNTKDMSL